MQHDCRRTVSFVAMLLFITATAPVNAVAPPNVIVILTDDMGYQDLGLTGCQDIKTPNIDGLATDGVNFSAAYVTASVCCPSRAGLLTGRYQQRFGHEFNNFSIPVNGFTQDDMGLNTDEQTIGDAFQNAGYVTACIGKWHMGGGDAFNPQERGFDEVFAMEAGSRSYWPYDGSGNAIRRIQIGGGELYPEDEITYLTDDLTSASVDFVRRHAEEPFFMYLAYTAPHTPMHAKEQDQAFYQTIHDKRRRTYAAMMKAVDDGIGQLRGVLDDLGVAKETLIVFTNDNGGATNNGSDNGRYRGMKGSKFEGGLRVPFVLTWPNGLPAGQSCDLPISTLDILPTTLAATGATYSGKPLDGVNLLPFARGERKGRPHEHLYWRRGVAAALRSGDWKIIRVQGNPHLLFDLASDPSETKNLAEQEPERVQAMLDRLAGWEEELALPRWTEGKKWERFQILKHEMSVRTRDQERKYP